MDTTSANLSEQLGLTVFTALVHAAGHGTSRNDWYYVDTIAGLNRPVIAQCKKIVPWMRDTRVWGATCLHAFKSRQLVIFDVRVNAEFYLVCGENDAKAPALSEI